MKYIFRLVRPHSKVPNLTAWYLFIDSVEMLLHIQDIKEKEFNLATSDVAERFISSPEKYGHYRHALSYAIDTTARVKFKDKTMTLFDLANIATDITWKPKFDTLRIHGGLYLGSNLFGFMPLSGQRIIKEEIKNELVFPDKEEVITIGKWPGGKHYYLRSSACRVLEDKYGSIESAEKAALRYVDKKHIKSLSHFLYMRYGD